MLLNDLFRQLFSFFLVRLGSAETHSKKSFNLTKNLYLAAIQNISE